MNTKELSHEINNSLTICKGYLKMIDLNNQERSTKAIEIIKSEFTRISDILQNNMNIINFNIDDLLKDVANLYSEIIEININSQDIMFTGNYNSLKEMFINIIKNSIEANSDEINIKVDKLDNQIVLKIKDNGIGIKKDNLKKLSSTKSNGHGIGTKLIFDIISKHQGSIKYNSKPNCGTLITIKLPILN